MIKTASAVALAAALFAGAATAQDRAIGEDSAYRFSNANDRAVRQNSLQMLQLRAAGYYDQIGAGSTVVANSASFNGASVNAPNFTQVSTGVQSALTNVSFSAASGNIGATSMVVGNSGAFIARP